MLAYPFAKEYPITQEYGENPGNYAKYGMVAHNGIDYGCPEGTQVLAAAAGTVEKATYDPDGYGWYVQIKHDGGLTTVYGHLTSCRVGALATVRAGQLIGISGSTGNSTGPHLHFEVRQAGAEHNGYWGAIDPRPLIAWPSRLQPTQTPAELQPGAIQVTAEVLNVRLGPSTNELSIGRVPMGTILKLAPGQAPVLEERGRWLPVVVYVAAERDGLRFVEGE